jgi:hypothetical protein
MKKTRSVTNGLMVIAFIEDIDSLLSGIYSSRYLLKYAIEA